MATADETQTTHDDTDHRGAWTVGRTRLPRNPTEEVLATRV